MRQWHNVSFNGFYTYSQTMTQRAAAEQHDAGPGARTSAKLADEYGRADTDQRHVFSLNMNWELDYYKGDNGFWRALLNGWAISPIIKLRSGLPFTVTNGNVDANLDGRPTTARSRSATRTSTTRRREQWFNTAAFVQNKIVTGAARRRQHAAQLARWPRLPRGRPGDLARLPAAARAS